jgi:translation elongation factor EF-G
MGLRIRCAAEHLETIKADLINRDARSIACECGSAIAPIQVCAPLVHLIGYGSILEQMTSGSAKHVMWLDHYAPVDHRCPGRSAGE